MHLRILAGENQIGLALRAVPPFVRTLLSLSQLDRVLRIIEAPTKFRPNA